MQMVDSVTSPPAPSSTTMSTRTKQNGLGVNVNNLKPNGSTPISESKSHCQSQPQAQNTSAERASEPETETESLDKMVEVSTILLQQAIDLANDSLSEDAQLVYDSKFIPGSTIGKHLRHATDHFALLLDSVSNPNPDSQSERVPVPTEQKELELSYDVRARGTPMESSRVAARETLENCIKRLRVVAPNMERDRPVKLTAVTPYVQTFRTSFGRELWFAALHAVHHWSMVRVIAGELGLQLEDSFGVAPSTLVYRGTEGPLGKAKI